MRVLVLGPDRHRQRGDRGVIEPVHIRYMLLRLSNPVQVHLVGIEDDQDDRNCDHDREERRVIKSQEECERLERVLGILLEADVVAFGKLSSKSNKIP